jgi:hypothetical protein
MLPSGQVAMRPLDPSSSSSSRRGIKRPYLSLVQGYLLPGQVSNVGFSRVG